jgi:bifunctional DNA-binding transcriptional regulator/antitoxin component of YhaV-PrlF toxin-antitoxin module
MAKRSFKGTLGARDSAGMVEVPFDVKQIFGSARPPVTATVNGVTWRTTVATYDGRFYVGMRKELRDRAGIVDGDPVEVTIESDDAPRTVDAPADLKKALRGSSAAKKAFDGLSFTHRREYVEWITGAKKDETRRRRVAKAIEMLEAGETR